MAEHSAVHFCAVTVTDASSGFFAGIPNLWLTLGYGRESDGNFYTPFFQCGKDLIRVWPETKDFSEARLGFFYKSNLGMSCDAV
jgi:hypothetical protein